MNNQLTVTISDNLLINVTPNTRHEYLMTIAEVAEAYGVSVNAISKAKNRHKGEFIEGLHWVFQSEDNLASVSNCPIRPIFITKAGVVRLGFFIRSRRAVLVRNFAERLVLDKLNQIQPITHLPAVQAPKRKKTTKNHPSLPPAKQVEILKLVTRIQDFELQKLFVDALSF